MSLIELGVVFYAGVSLATLVTYARDKHAAQRPGAPRVRERTLHLWALAGGFADAWLGRRWLRHKTRHAVFAWVAGLSAALHAGAWAWWWVER